MKLAVATCGGDCSGLNAAIRAVVRAASKNGDEVMLITDRGQTLRTRVDEIRETGRNAQGVKLMTVDGDERIVALERLAESAPGEEGGGSEAPPGLDGGSIPPTSVPPPPEELN